MLVFLQKCSWQNRWYKSSLQHWCSPKCKVSNSFCNKIILWHFSDISLISTKFHDISRFSRQVITLWSSHIFLYRCRVFLHNILKIIALWFHFCADKWDENEADFRSTVSAEVLVANKFMVPNMCPRFEDTRHSDVGCYLQKQSNVTGHVCTRIIV